MSSCTVARAPILTACLLGFALLVTAPALGDDYDEDEDSYVEDDEDDSAMDEDEDEGSGSYARDDDRLNQKEAMEAARDNYAGALRALPADDPAARQLRQFVDQLNRDIESMKSLSPMTPRPPANAQRSPPPTARGLPPSRSGISGPSDPRAPSRGGCVGCAMDAR